MKTTCLMLALACGGAAWAQGDVAAKVREVHGSVLSGSKMLVRAASVGAGTWLRLGDGADLTLVFKQDGHSEHVIGPCDVKIDARHVHKMTRYGRVTVVDSSGHEHLVAAVGNAEAGGSYEAGTGKAGFAIPATHEAEVRPPGAATLQGIAPAPVARRAQLQQPKSSPGDPSSEVVACAQELEEKRGKELLAAGREALKRYPKDPYLLLRLYRRYTAEGLVAQAKAVRSRASALGIKTDGADWR